MSSIVFQKATKAKSYARVAITGISGNGKTFTSLAVACAMAKQSGDRLAVIDSENGSASKYSDRFDFDTISLMDRSVDGYIEAIDAAKGAGYKYLLIDSTTHAWKELLAEVTLIANNKYRGNTHAAWGDANSGTPKQTKFIDAILFYPGHVFATMRSKTEWEITEDDNGKKKPVRIGLAPQQGKDIEFEFDLLLEMTSEHNAIVLKDRTGKYQDQIIEKPGDKFGKDLYDWLNAGPGEFIAPKSPVTASQDEAAIRQAYIAELGGIMANAKPEIKEKYKALLKDTKTVALPLLIQQAKAEVEIF